MSTIFRAFKLLLELPFASEERKSVGSSTGVTESKVLDLLCLTIFLGLTLLTTLGRLFRSCDDN